MIRKNIKIWNRVIHLSATVQREELLQLPQLSLLHRLYHEEEVRVFEPSLTCFRCSCSKDRVNNMLRVLGYDEVKSILQEQGQINVACEFCNQKYIFDSVDAEQLFASVASPPTSDSKH